MQTREEFVDAHITKINTLGTVLNALALMDKFSMGENFPFLHKQFLAKSEELKTELITISEGVLQETDLISLENHIRELVIADTVQRQPTTEYLHDIVKSINQAQSSSTNDSDNNVVLLNASRFFKKNDTLTLFRNSEIAAGLLSLVGPDLNDYPALIKQMNKPDYNYGAIAINYIPRIIDQYVSEKKSDYLLAIRRGFEDADHPNIKLNNYEWSKLDQWISESLYDVSTIEIDDQLHDVVRDGLHRPSPETWITEHEYIMERFNIDMLAARRLSERVMNLVRQRYVDRWNNSKAGKLVHQIKNELEKLDLPFVHTEERDVEHVPGISSGNSTQYVSIENVDPDNAESSARLRLSVHSKTFNHKNNNLIELKFEDFNEGDIPELLAAIKNNHEKECYGFEWTRARNWKPHEITHKNIGYNDQVREYLRQAENAGLFPEGLKYTVSKGYYKSIAITISKLPEGLPVLNPVYEKAELTKAHYEYFTPQFNLLYKVIKDVGEAGRYCTDDGHNSDYGAVHNYDVDIKFKDSLKEEMRERVAKDAKEGVEDYQWQYSPSQFTQKSIPQNDKLPIAKKYEVQYQIDRGYKTINDLMGSKRDEYYKPFSIMLLDDALDRLKEFKTQYRLPKGNFEQDIKSLEDRLGLYKLDVEHGMNFEAAVSQFAEKFPEGVSFKGHLLKFDVSPDASVSIRVSKVYPEPVTDLQTINLVFERSGKNKLIGSVVCTVDRDSLRDIIEPVLSSHATADVLNALHTGVLNPAQCISILSNRDLGPIELYSPSCFDGKTILLKSNSDWNLVTEDGKLMCVTRPDQIEKIQIIAAQSTLVFECKKESPGLTFAQ